MQVYDGPWIKDLKTAAPFRNRSSMKRDRYSGARAPRFKKASKALLTAIWKDLSLLQASLTILHAHGAGAVRLGSQSCC